MGRSGIRVWKNIGVIYQELHDIVREALEKRSINNLNLRLREISLHDGTYVLELFELKAPCGHRHNPKSNDLVMGIAAPSPDRRKPIKVEGEGDFPLDINIVVDCHCYFENAKAIAKYFAEKTGKSAAIQILV